MSIFAGVASAGVGGDPLPAPALTPTDTITIHGPVTSTVVPGGDQLSVTADSTTPLSGMTVHLLDATSGLHVQDLTMKPPAGGATAGVSVWTSDPITTTVVPLGTYNVTVDASDTGGTTMTGITAPPPPFAFQGTPTVTLRVDPVLSYSNQHPTVSGTVTTLAPGATIPEPYADQSVFLADPRLPGGGIQRPTDAHGDFSYTFTDPLPGETFTAEVLPTPAVVAASTAGPPFTTHTDQVAMSARLSAKAITYGSKVTVGGTVSYRPGSTFVPLPGQAVRIYDRPGAPRPVVTAVTDAKGHFAATLPKEAASAHWVLQAAGPYLNPASVTLPMKVSLRTVISGFQVALNQFWQVSFRGCLALPAGVPGSVPSLAGLTIQYAAGPDGPWRTLGTLPKQASVLCGNGGRTFSGTLTARLNYAYYRAWYAGGTNAAGTGYLPSAGAKVLAWKYEDRIIAFSVSARTLHRGATLTVKGQLQYFLGKWRPYARQHVYVILRPQGSKTWYFIVVATTSPAGAFSASFGDPVTATWSAEFFGSSTHLATLAPTIFVGVT